MSNLLNSIIANQSINPEVQEPSSAFTFDTNGKIKPLNPKGQLLPSQIFGSPIEYVKDLKKDVVSIGKAAKGEANDYELGRINDVAMKLGALGLASYLCVKNPLKLNKVMEFVGVGTFFGGMALWPKLTIQAPIKARTGVDIHQKYIDSQGRKKMLHQDPQYDLTDLYSREDLDKMGAKLKVNENLDDRDSFIKQRAKKTAIQGNTLWMMSAFSTPLISAIACNRLEKPITNLLEKYDLYSTEKLLDNPDKGLLRSLFSEIKSNSAQKSFEDFIGQNSDKVLDDNLISELAERIAGGTNSSVIVDAVKDELKQLKSNVKLDENFVRQALKDFVSEEALSKLADIDVESTSIETLSSILAKASPVNRSEQKKLYGKISKALHESVSLSERATIAGSKDKIRQLYSAMASLTSEKSLLDKFISARVGDKSGTYIANQWGRVGDKLVKLLKFNTEELKQVSEGNMDILLDKLHTLADEGHEVEYNQAVKDIFELISDYEEKTGESFVSKTAEVSEEIFGKAAAKLEKLGFNGLASKLTAKGKDRQLLSGTVENLISVNTNERIKGAQSSFYRLIQALDIVKQRKDGTLERRLSEMFVDLGGKYDTESIKKLADLCEKVIFDATTTDYIEKFESAGFKFSENEYKAIMQLLFGKDKENVDVIRKSLGESVASQTNIDKMIAGFTRYKQEVMDKIVNWQNNMTPDLSHRVISGSSVGSGAAERSSLTGKPISDMFKDYAKQAYNSKKWFKIFGIALLSITAVTLAAGLTFGKKSKMEKQAEEEKKVNG